jgi:hypothetical protein
MIFGSAAFSSRDFCAARLPGVVITSILEALSINIFPHKNVCLFIHDVILYVHTVHFVPRMSIETGTTKCFFSLWGENGLCKSRKIRY